MTVKILIIIAAVIAAIAAIAAAAVILLRRIRRNDPSDAESTVNHLENKEKKPVPSPNERKEPLPQTIRSKLENERINLMSDLKVALSKARNDWEMLTRSNQTCSEFVFYYQLFATKKRNLEAAVKQCQEFDKRLEELLNSYDEDSVMKLSIAAEESFQKAEALISESSRRLSSISSAEDACAITQEELEAWLSEQ